jgi:predicted amidohydrolase
MTRTVRIAVVSPLSVRGAGEEDHVAAAVRYVEQAAEQGARIVCFPEGYPGPYSGPCNYSAVEALQRCASAHGVYVIAGMVEPAPELGDNVFYLAQKLIGPEGTVGTHRRVLPNPKEMTPFLMGGKDIAPGDDLQVWNTPFGRIGVLICSEAWSPELALILTLKGADIIFAPIGGAVAELYDNWKIILRARAAENDVYVATCQHIWDPAEKGMGMVAGPERVVAESEVAGVLVADVDLDRLTWLREHSQEMVLPKPYSSIPGMLRHRRPELYGEITAPREDLYDFTFYAHPSSQASPLS